MRFRGRVWKFGDNIDTDVIIPARYCTTFDPKQLAQHVMEGVDERFAQNVKAGDIVVAGRNFGCGSSREMAVLALLGAGIRCVVAQSFARIFFRNAVNNGLWVAESSKFVDEVRQGEEVEVDFAKGVIQRLGTNKEYELKKPAKLMMEILESGGAVAYFQRQILSKRFGG